MTPKSEAALNEVLTAYSRGEMTLDTAMRRLVSHRGWIAPAPPLQDHYGWDGFSNVTAFSIEARLPANELWLFTDYAAVKRAQTAGAKLGPCAVSVAGVDLFAGLNPVWELARINVGSPAELTLNVAKSAFDLARGWSVAIRLEDQLAQWAASNAPPNEAVLRAHPEFLMFINPGGGVVTLRNTAGLTNGAALFTAPDCCEAFLGRLTAEQKGSFRQTQTTGAEILAKLPQQGVDGLIINAFGPGTFYVVSFRGP